MARWHNYGRLKRNSSVLAGRGQCFLSTMSLDHGTPYRPLRLKEPGMLLALKEAKPFRIATGSPVTVST
jgi:hypothetical protein